MKKILTVFGVIGACALCCSLPLAIPALGTLLVSGAGFTLGWEAALCIAVVLAGVVLLWRARRARARKDGCSAAACGADANNGCEGSCQLPPVPR